MSMSHHAKHSHAPLLSVETQSRGSTSSSALSAIAWVEAFNDSSVNRLILLYAPNAQFNQPAEEPVIGRKAIMLFLNKCFALHRKTPQEDRTCLIDNLLVDGEWAVVRWHDALGCTGCYMFRFEKELIVRQYGFWDTKASEMVYETNLP